MLERDVGAELHDFGASADHHHKGDHQLVGFTFEASAEEKGVLQVVGDWRLWAGAKAGHNLHVVDAVAHDWDGAVAAASGIIAAALCAR